MKVVSFLSLAILSVRSTTGFIHGSIHKIICKFFQNSLECSEESDAFDSVVLFPFQLHNQLFGPSQDEDGNVIYPTYILPNGWTDPKNGSFPALTVDGQTFDLQFLEILSTWEDILPDILANTTNATATDYAQFQATSVLASIGANRTFFGLVAQVNRTDGAAAATYVFPVDDAIYFGNTPPARRRTLQSTPASLPECPNFFTEVLAEFECPTAGDKVSVNDTCKTEVEFGYTMDLDVAQGNYDTAIAAAQAVWDATKTVFWTNQTRQYAPIMANCTRQTDLAAIALCVWDELLEILGPLLQAKHEAENAFNGAVENATSDRRDANIWACHDANTGSAPCIDCIACSVDTATEIECCVASDCSSAAVAGEEFICESNKCIQKGNPRFTLTWFGIDDLDLHVITPGGFEIYFDDDYDVESGGLLDHDDVPEKLDLWVENTIFPLDGSAPRGTYTYFVVNYDQNSTMADAYTLQVFLGDTLQVTHNGVVEELEDGPQFTFVF